MSLKEQIYSVLVVSAAEKLNIALTELLPASHFEPVKVVSNVSAAKREWSARSYDFVIVNSPLPDESGIRFAIDLSPAKTTVILLLVRSEISAEVKGRVTDHGVFTLPKPVAKQSLSLALDWMAASRERLRAMEVKTLSVEEKMEEIRTVNRAKWLLISVLSMDEPEAHRYIEKQAMDRGVPKLRIAEEIIHTYA